MKFLFAFLLFSLSCFAYIPKSLVISKISAGEGKKNEFIQLYNPTFEFIKLKNVVIKVKERSIEFEKDARIIPPFAYFLLIKDSESDIKNYDATFTTPSISENSYIEVLVNNETVDLVGFGSVTGYEGAPCDELKLKKMLAREVVWLDTNNNKEDFILLDFSSQLESLASVPYIPPFARANSKEGLKNKVNLYKNEDVLWKTTDLEIKIKEGFGIFTKERQKETLTISSIVEFFFSFMNTANKEDTFYFDVVSNFDAKIFKGNQQISQITLAQGGVCDFVVRIQVPEDAIKGEENITKVYVKNQNGKGEDDDIFEEDTVLFLAKTTVKEGKIPEVDLNLLADKDVVVSGDSLEYTIRIQNNHSTLTNVSIVDELPQRVYLQGLEVQEACKIFYDLGDGIWLNKFSPHARRIKISFEKLTKGQIIEIKIKVKVY